MQQVRRKLFALPSSRWTMKRCRNKQLCNDLQLAAKPANETQNDFAKWQTPAVSDHRILTKTFVALLVSVSFFSTGCHSWSPGSQIRQCQLESDRLLAEFRAQKKRSDELEAKLAQEQDLRAEAEKQLARLQNGSRSSSSLAGRSNSTSLQEGFSGRTTPSGSAGNTGSGPANMSSLGRNPNSLISSPQNSNVDRDIQWRPKGAPLR